MMSMFSLIFCMFGLIPLGFVWPNATDAFVAMKKLFEVLDTKIIADATREDGKKPENFVGRIEFKNVTFSYPT